MKRNVLVCCGTNCLAKGAAEVLDALKREASGLGLDIRPSLKATGCNGFCENGPVVEIQNEDGSDIIYFKVRPEDAGELIAKTALKGEIISRLCDLGKEGARISSKREILLCASDQNRAAQCRPYRPVRH